MESHDSQSLINEEGIAEASVFSLEPPGVLGTELDAPRTDRLIANQDAARGQQILYVTSAHVEPVIEPNGVLNDLRRESVTFVQR